jgi:hypothetical protein
MPEPPAVAPPVPSVPGAPADARTRDNSRTRERETR